VEMQYVKCLASAGLGLAIFALQGCQLASVASRFSPVPAPPEDPNQLTPAKLGVIVNRRDRLSVQIAEYYQLRRAIPPENLIWVEFDPGQTVLSPERFAELYAAVQAQTPDRVQAYALTWSAPYRVGCMSITAAFTFGFDPSLCGEGCSPTAASPYFNSDRPNPQDSLAIRPTMAIAATSLEAAQALIERGIAADDTAPAGTAYLLSTTDAARNVRSPLYPEIQAQLSPYFAITLVQNNALVGRDDAMFYFTGLSQVASLETNQYPPGAVADHLTSFGGQLTDSPQMSSLRWLEAGATGSYGTVVEPCNFPQKFPHPGVLMAHYLNGDTLIEAYWKSVLMPGQGIFIGEPLARPFPPH
jgi:uncharacterized protein (TIGR03790 family)